MNNLGQDSLDITVLREKVLKEFPNQNYDTLYNTQFVPSDGLIDTISLEYKGDQTKAEEAHGIEYERNFLRDTKDPTYKRFFSKDSPVSVV